MELSVTERLLLLNILPQQGNALTLKIVKDLQGELSFSEAEIELYGFDQRDGSLYWESEKETPKEVDVGKKALSVISERLEELNKGAKLSMDQLSLYERFGP